jgi:hypothetical protein
MKSRILFGAALILLAPLAVWAFQVQSNQVRKGELKSRPFTAGPLKITLVEFYGGGIAFPVGQIRVVVENTSDEFTIFDPQRLSFVDTNNNQVDIFGITRYHQNKTWIVAAASKRIGPKARIKNLYSMTDDLQLPLRLYYEDKLLATIIY